MRIVEEDVDKHAIFEGIRSKIKNNVFIQKLLVNAHAVDRAESPTPKTAKASENLNTKDWI